MIWCIATRSGRPLPSDLDVDFSGPADTLRALEIARQQISEDDLVVLRDGEEISLTELVGADAERHCEVQQLLDSESRLPASFRPARYGEPDLASGADGPIPVRKPENPEDRFD